MLLKMGEVGIVDLLVSSQVLEEIENVIRRKAAQLLATLTVLLYRSQAKIGQTAPDELIERCCKLVSHPGDGRILADAWNNQAYYLVTLDRAYFLDVPGLAGQVPFPIGTPEDCTVWIREKLSQYANSNTEFDP